MSVRAGNEAVIVSPKLGCEIGIGTKFLAVAAIVSITLFASSCASVLGAGSGHDTPPPRAVAVTISPTSSHITAGGTVQFTAAVANTSNSGVVWSAKGGTISSDGLFVASKTASSASITVASVASPESTASAAVTFATATPLAISSASLPTARTGAPYSAHLSSSGGTPPYSWSIASGSLPQGLSLAASGTISGTPIQVGSSTFSVKVTDSASESKSLDRTLSVTAGSNLNYSGFDGPAELPRVYMETSLADTPAPGSATTVKPGGDLQAALNNANCGDTILLQSGAVFAG